MPTSNDSGYDCWLGFPPLPASSLLDDWRQLCSRVVLRGWSPTLQLAGEELSRGSSSLLGTPVALQAGGGGAGPSVVLGTADDPELEGAIALAGVERLALASPGSFAFIPLPASPPGSLPAGGIAVVGGDDRGCLYGAFALLRCAGTGSPPPGGPVVEAPAAPLRILEHWDNIDGSVERGYAGRSIFFDRGEVTSNMVRIADYGRLLASIGVNAVAVNNVNVSRAAVELLTPRHLGRLRELAGVLRPFGLRIVLSVNFASPVLIGGLPSADPADAAVGRWWAAIAQQVYRYIPDLVGFLVKASSEGQPGPHSYGRSQAEGANVLARALAPFGGTVIWRSFVYDSAQDWRDTKTDRAKAAFNEFAPLDGAFAPNVALQVKSGPMDFQVREPPSPLLGAMPMTAKLLEVQITQEYTGQQVHVCYLPPSWKEVLDFDTHALGQGSTVAELVVRGRPAASQGVQAAGMAGVANVGDDPNWTGHLLAQANLYGFGRLAWAPSLSAQEVAKEWSKLSFGLDEEVTQAVTSLLMRSWPVYESYTSPLGLGWMVTPHTHYGPSPEGYEYSRWGTYHRADRDAIGIDRTRAAGTGFTGQYHEPWSSVFEDPERCPEELLLFFHRLAYSHTLHSGKTLAQHVYDSHFQGVEMVRDFLGTWRHLEGKLNPAAFASVEQRLEEQLRSAEQWRDVINAYFHRISGIPDEKGRALF